MGLARHPEVFRCGAAWVAVTEPRLLFDFGYGYGNDIAEEYRQYGLPALLGDPVEDADMLE